MQGGWDVQAPVREGELGRRQSKLSADPQVRDELVAGGLQFASLVELDVGFEDYSPQIFAILRGQRGGVHACHALLQLAGELGATNVMFEGIDAGFTRRADVGRSAGGSAQLFEGSTFVLVGRHTDIVDEARELGSFGLSFGVCTSEQRQRAEQHEPANRLADRAMQPSRPCVERPDNRGRIPITSVVTRRASC